MKKIIAFFQCVWQCLLVCLGIAVPAILDHPYAEHPVRQRMDIYMPRKKGAADVILFIHGGGWWEGDKSSYGSACKNYAKKGYAAAAVNYRFIENLPPDQQAVSCADMLDDIDSAVAALQAKLTEKGRPPRKMMIMGLSAGGHLALLYGYSRHGQCAVPVAFVCSDVGPTDFTDPAYTDTADGWAIVEQGYRLANDAASDLKGISPICHVGPDVPPTLMRYGALDTLVPASQGTRLKEALDTAGVRGDLFVYPNSGHIVDTKKDSPTDALFNAKLLEYLQTYF